MGKIIMRGRDGGKRSEGKPCWRYRDIAMDHIGLEVVATNSDKQTGYVQGPEPGSIPLRNWNLLPIPSPELNWNCHHWN